MSLLVKEALKWGSTNFTVIALTFLVICTIVWYFRRLQKVRLIEQLPGPKESRVFGSALYLNAEGGEGFRRFVDLCKYGKVMRFWLLHIPCVIISGATEAEVLLSSSRYIDKSGDYVFLQPWLGTGLLTSTGRKWHSRRKLLTPAFHFKILEDFVEVFNVQSMKMIDILQKKADGKAFDITRYIAHCALDIICESAMGQNASAQGNAESEYVKAVYKIGPLIDHRMMSPWLHPYPLFKLLGYAKEHDESLQTLHSFTTSVIQNRRLNFGENTQIKSCEESEILGKKKRLAFLDLLLECSENGNPLTDDDIREEVDTFMFAGHDTTTVAINWALYMLGSYPEIQERVFEELDQIFGESDRHVTTDDLREMKLMENCIKETLRLYPSVPCIGRELKEELVIGNQRIPAGVTAMVMTYALHRDPDQFPDPEVFDPDRFLPENCQKRHHYAYIPFSAGPRNCIGQKFAMMEEKVVLANVLRKYRVESVVKPEELQVTGELILRPEEGNIIRLYPRKD